MVERCNNVGVRIYVDAVINHMAGMDREGTGSAGSSFNTMNNNHDFPAVPYSDSDFTPSVGLSLSFKRFSHYHFLGHVSFRMWLC